MGVRVQKEVLYLKHEYTNEERLRMGSDLGAAYNRRQAVQDEEKVMKGQIKGRMSLVEATIGTLSRNLNDGYTMENVDCDLVWDSPNVGEVSYQRRDNAAIVKTRAMTAAENQLELELAQADTQTAPAAESVVNIESFFGEGSIDALKAADAGNSAIIDAATEAMAGIEEAEDDDTIFSNPDPAAATEAIKPEHDAAWAGTTGAAKPRGRGRPKGSTKKEPELAETF